MDIETNFATSVQRRITKGLSSFVKCINGCSRPFPECVNDIGEWVSVRCLDLTENGTESQFGDDKLAGPFTRVIVDADSTMFCPRVLALLMNEDGLLEVNVKRHRKDEIISCLADVGFELSHLQRGFRQHRLIMKLASVPQ